jgi:hypothetical protein
MANAAFVTNGDIHRTSVPKQNPGVESVLRTMLRQHTFVGLVDAPIDGTLEIILTGRLGVPECHIFLAHYYFYDTVYMCRWNDTQIHAN